MTLDPSLVTFLQWLVSQGIGVAIAILVLLRLETKLERQSELMVRIILLLGGDAPTPPKAPTLPSPLVPLRPQSG